MGLTFYMDLRKFKFHCSSLGKLLTEAKNNKDLTTKQKNDLVSLISKEKPLTDLQIYRLQELLDKSFNYDPNKVSPTLINHLITLYVKYQYHKSPISQTYYDQIFSVSKGANAEIESINLLSKIDGLYYVKNTKTFTNRFIKGTPDIVDTKNKKIIEIKTSIDMVSFFNNKTKLLERDYKYQMLGYLHLTGYKYGEVIFCLVNPPEPLLNNEIKKLKAKLLLQGYDDYFIDKKVQLLISSMTFDDIPIHKKVIRFRVEKDDDAMTFIYDKIKYCRKWIKKFSQKDI
jgi:hypothetical protein